MAAAVVAKAATAVEEAKTKQSAVWTRLNEELKDALKGLSPKDAAPAPKKAAEVMKRPAAMMKKPARAAKKPRAGEEAEKAADADAIPVEAPDADAILEEAPDAAAMEDAAPAEADAPDALDAPIGAGEADLAIGEHVDLPEIEKITKKEILEGQKRVLVLSQNTWKPLKTK